MGLADTNTGAGSVAIDVSGGNQTVTGRAIWIGGVGNVAVVHPDGSSGIFYGCQEGTMLEVAVTQITQTGTSITNSRVVK